MTATDFMGYPANDLRDAFNVLHDPADWRAPIDVYVDPRSAQFAVASIVFMTATKPIKTLVETPNGYRVRVQSEGYRNGPAGP